MEQADHFDSAGVQNVAPLQVLVVDGVVGDGHLAWRRSVRGDEVVQGAAGPLLAAGERGDEGGRGAVEEVGAEFVPADGNVVDEVAGHSFDAAFETALVGGEQ